MFTECLKWSSHTCTSHRYSTALTDLVMNVDVEVKFIHFHIVTETQTTTHVFTISLLTLHSLTFINKRHSIAYFILLCSINTFLFSGHRLVRTDIFFWPYWEWLLLCLADRLIIEQHTYYTWSSCKSFIYARKKNIRQTRHGCLLDALVALF